MAIYMKYVAKQLGEIKGAVTSKGHEKWIEVTSVEFGYTRPAQGQVATGAPVISELRMTRHVDMSSPLLAQAGIANDVAKVTVHYVKDGTVTTPYMTVELANAVINHYDHLGFGDDSTVEKLAVTFTQLTYTWVAGGIVTVFDIAKNK